MWLLDHWQFEAGDVVSIERVSVRFGDCGLNFLFLWRSTAVPALNVCDFVAADFLCYRLVWALNNHLWTSSLLNNLKLLTSDPRITSFHYMLPHRWPVLICGDPVIYLIQSVLLVNATITVIRSCKVSNYITSACNFTYSEYVLVCIYMGIYVLVASLNYKCCLINAYSACIFRFSTSVGCLIFAMRTQGLLVYHRLRKLGPRCSLPNDLG